MANPNILAATTLLGNSSTTSLSTTSATSIANNAASSGKVYRVNSIVVSNNDATTAYPVTINLYSAASLGGTAYPLVTSVSVPATAAVVVSDKTAAFYLLENQSIGATAGTANKITVIASWEEIS